MARRYLNCLQTCTTMPDHNEATLEDLLKEPIILSMMARDGVRAAEIRRLLEQVRERQERSQRRRRHQD